MIPIAINEKAVQNTFYRIQREGIKSLAVTSARRQEGVTAFSYALARRAATAGVRVLLVDFNLAHPGQSEQLALEHKEWNPSLPISTDDIYQLSDTNLAVLSAPGKVKNTWPFQDKEKIGQMLDRLYQDYDLIIADMPSILDRHTDLQVEIVCAAFEATIITMLSGKAVETEMMALKKILDESDVQVLGAIMNDQFTPSLVEEIIRQLDKMRNYCPRLADFLSRRVEKNAFLNQSF